jgi:hypothetical protein
MAARFTRRFAECRNRWRDTAGAAIRAADHQMRRPANADFFGFTHSAHFALNDA